MTGRSFAVILRAQREAYGRDVFGLSPRGTAWVQSQAWARWDQWKRGTHPERPPVTQPLGKQLPRYKVQREIRGRTDLGNMDLTGNEAEIKGMGKQFTGFRRLNARGEIWKPGHQLWGRANETAAGSAGAEASAQTEAGAEANWKGAIRSSDLRGQPRLSARGR